MKESPIFSSAVPYLVGIGAVNLDIMGCSLNPLVMEDSNPGLISTSVGGVSHNICENAARLGLSVKLISVTGDDPQGAVIREGCRQGGLDISCLLTLPGRRSSTYLSIHGQDGEMAVALSDMRILQELRTEYLEKHRPLLEGAAVIVMDCGLPEEVLKYVAQTFGNRIPIFVDPVSTAYARKLLGSLDGIHTVKPNRLEAQVMAGMEIKDLSSLKEACQRILNRGVRRVVISLGREGAFALDQEGRCLQAPAFPLAKVVNATGAGDCFMGALAFAHIQRMPPGQALAFASCASALALSHKSTINPHLTEAAVWRVLARYPFTV